MHDLNSMPREVHVPASMEIDKRNDILFLDEMLPDNSTKPKQYRYDEPIRYEVCNIETNGS